MMQQTSMQAHTPDTDVYSAQHILQSSSGCCTMFNTGGKLPAQAGITLATTLSQTLRIPFARLANVVRLAKESCETD
jgi:hypothetical protein